MNPWFQCLRRLLSLWLILGAFSAFAAPAPYTVLSVRGAVTVASAGSERATERSPKVGVLMVLPAGTKVWVAPDAELIVYRSGEDAVLRLRAGEHVLPAVMPTAAGDALTRAREALPESLRGVRIDIGNAAQASLVMRSNGQDRLRVLAPVGVLMPGEVPDIRWAGSRAHAPVRITIADWQGNRVVSEETTENAWRPELSQALTPGTRYRYSVFGRAHGGRPGENDFGEFRVMTESEAARLRSKEPPADSPSHHKHLYLALLKSARALQAAEAYEKSL